ncbi:MAG: dihydropteroate synthase [Candidatus Omnitrophota bacterium]
MKDFAFGSRTYIMGILNLTPDSFSGDGIYLDQEKAVNRAERMAADGADIIDVGGESTRPGAAPVSLEEEIKRVIPVIKKITRSIKTPVSIDTTKPEVARQALDNGASIINDVTGLEKGAGMARLAAEFDAKVVLMHMKGEPGTMQDNPVYGDLIEEIIEKLRQLAERAEAGGVKKENIIVDPGIGFGKTLEHNLEILRRLGRFKVLGRPILVGPSRKAFIGKILGAEPDKRVFGTAGAAAVAIQNGADIVRVHDVREIKEAAAVADAITRRGNA